MRCAVAPVGFAVRHGAVQVAIVKFSLPFLASDDCYYYYYHHYHYYVWPGDGGSVRTIAYRTLAGLGFLRHFSPLHA